MPTDLFTSQPQAPLAERLRPKNINDMIGQQHLVGQNRPLRTAIESGKIYSMILWGPPGVGKTTLARILASSFDAVFLPISAVLSGVKEIRLAVERAEQSLTIGKRTILFVDEVHRFNKSQQDAFLPYVENGLITFIGATTENPSFEVNSALLSRAHVYTLKSLTENELLQLIDKILHLPEYLMYQCQEAERKILAQAADGDARKLLNILEQLLNAAENQQISQLSKAFLQMTLGSQIRRFDKGADGFYEQISALHKSVRGSHPNAALYWFCRMIDGGADARYLSRRMIRMAWEDIGLADPRAMQIANDAATTYERLGSPEGELALAQALIYLACAPKSNAGYQAFNEAKVFVKNQPTYDVPIHLRNAPTQLMQELGYGKAYRYAHDEPYAYAAGEQYMPDEIDEPQWYQPVNRGLEKQIGERLKWLASLDADSEKDDII